MKVAVGTTSKLKVRALKNALEKLGVEAEVVAIQAESRISKQPFGFEETTRGAKNRARCVLEETGADLALGVESGLMEIEKSHFDIACAYVLSKNSGESCAYSSGIMIPRWIVEKVKEKGTEIGYIVVGLSGEHEKDGFKYLSGGVIKREESISQAILLALAKIFNKEKYNMP